MTTKFSKRPATRKRPWICKRSPPCLKPKPFPPSLLASFFLQKIQPSPHAQRYTGSLILPWRPMLALYMGSWVEGTNGFTCTFTHHTTTGISQAIGTWDLGGLLDLGAYPSLEIKLHPYIRYRAYYVQATTYGWRTQLDITG